MKPIPSDRFDRSLVWFRRDLRSDDHTAMHHALLQSKQVFCVFIFDEHILQSLPRQDRRVAFIHSSLIDLNQHLCALSGQSDAVLEVRHGDPAACMLELVKALGVQAVFANHDDEPYALKRDAEIKGALANQGVSFVSFKDHVVFERDEILTQNNQPYGVFTPYKNNWLKKIRPDDLKERTVKPAAGQLVPVGHSVHKAMPSLEEMGFEEVDLQATPSGEDSE
jgi:deoxyribodipyrimidine photo-lyase